LSNISVQLKWTSARNYSDEAGKSHAWENYQPACRYVGEGSFTNLKFVWQTAAFAGVMSGKSELHLKACSEKIV
jgi:hypothetical protein